MEKGVGFNSTRGVQQMLVYKKITFDRYYCIKHSVMQENSKILKKLQP